MSITHKQAHYLIQLKMEDMLNSQEAATLSAHLRECGECHTYASEIKDLTGLLPSIMKKHWSARPVPLSIPSLVKRKEKTKASTIMTMRTAAISLVFMALFFGARNLGLPRPSSTSESPFTLPAVPTPSAVTASSTSTQQDCALLVYRVQEGDTLSSISEKFSVPEAALMELNKLKTESVSPSMGLLVPVCSLTPTETIHPATFTTTYTPALNAITSTPGG